MWLSYCLVPYNFSGFFGSHYIYRHFAKQIITTVVAIFWARVLCRLAAENARIRMMITLESSSFVPCFVRWAFQVVSGAVPEWPWIRRSMIKSSRQNNVPKMRFSVLLNSWDDFLVTLPSISSDTLSDVVFLRSGNIRALCQVAPSIFLPKTLV